MKRIDYRRFMRFTLKVFVAFLLVLTASLFWYDISNFEPRRAEIDLMMSSANPNDKSPPPFVRDLIMVSHDKAHLSRLIARQLLFRFDDRSDDGIGWNLRYALWIQLVHFHYDVRELVGLYAVLVDRDHLTGLNNISQKYFAKSTSELDKKESALLIASMKIPFSDAARLERSANDLLAMVARKEAHRPGGL